MITYIIFFALQCVICLSAKATMQTFPCSHTVVCRKCFVKTIQMAVSQRCLPLRCVICRSRILKLRQVCGGQSNTPKPTPSKFFSKFRSRKSLVKTKWPPCKHVYALLYCCNDLFCLHMCFNAIAVSWLWYNEDKGNSFSKTNSNLSMSTTSIIKSTTSIDSRV